MLKPNGKLLVLAMEWLPFEDDIARQSEELVLKYNAKWGGAGAVMQPIEIPELYYEQFKLVYSEEYRLDVRFTRESWNGRMKACRGVGASLSEEQIRNWEAEHKALLERIAPPEFDIHHYAAIAELQKRVW